MVTEHIAVDCADLPQCNKMSCLTINGSPFIGLKLLRAYGQTHDEAVGAFVELLIVHTAEN